MVIYQKLLKNGSEVENYYNLKVSKAMSDNENVSQFSCEVENFAGRNKDFQVGDLINIYCGSSYDGIVGSGLYTTGTYYPYRAYLQFNNSVGSFIPELISNTYFELMSGATLSQGILGSAIAFNGSPCLCSGARTFAGTHSQSYMFWCKPHNTGSAILVREGGTGMTNGNAFFTRNGSLYANHYVGAGSMSWSGTTMGGSYFTIGGSIGFDNWIHVAYTVGSQLGDYHWHDCNLWINGSIVATDNFSGCIVSNSTTFGPQTAQAAGIRCSGVGGFGSIIGGTCYYSGLIDDFRCLTDTIGSQYILQAFNNGVGSEYASGAAVYQTTYSGLLFAGILEDVKYKGDGLNEKITLNGRDYICRLTDRTVEPEVYNNLDAGSIVKDIVSKYTEEITTNNVYSGTNVKRVRFNQTPVYDAIKQLADMSNFYFYVDLNKDLHFEPKSTINSNFTLYSGNCMGANFKEQRDTCYNQVWVYGDRYLSAFQEIKTGGDAVGSVFNLLYKPHSLSILNNGSAVQPGGILNMGVAGSTVKYLVSYEDAKVIMTSGTSQGNNLPNAGSVYTFNYDRLLPIVKVGDDYPSQQEYGKRVKVIVDTDIKDPNTAQDIMTTTLAESNQPSVQGDLEIEGLFNLTPGNLCTVDLPYHNVVNQNYDILSVDYDFNIINCQKEDVMKIKVNKKIGDVSDTIKDIMLRLKKLEAGEMEDTDILTRFQATTGSFSIRQSGLMVTYRGIGSSFILGHPVNGLIGSYTSHTLGDWRTGSTIYWSGGYF